jgi:hypothetical protein
MFHMTHLNHSCPKKDIETRIWESDASFPVSQFPQLNKSMDVILSIVREMISLEHRPLLIEYFPGFVDDEAPPPT